MLAHRATLISVSVALSKAKTFTRILEAEAKPRGRQDCLYVRVYTVVDTELLNLTLLLGSDEQSAVFLALLW